MQTTVKHRIWISYPRAFGGFIAVLLALTCPSFQWRASAQDPMDDDMDRGRFFRAIGMTGALVGDEFVPNPSTDPTYTRLDYPGALLTVAYDINNSGNIVGLYEDANSDFHGFLYNRVTRSFASIDYTNPVCTTGTDARGINERGDIGGTCTDAGGNFYGYLLTADGFTSIFAPGHLSTIAQGISSDGGNIVGCIHDTNMSTTMFGMWLDSSGFNFFGGLYGGLNGRGFMNNGVSPNGRIVAGLFTDTSVSPARTRAYILREGEAMPFDYGAPRLPKPGTLTRRAT
jgi:probable HAF family extracellular repeat protein